MMLLMDNPAFFGTGVCDPNKDMKQFLAFVAVVAGWTVIAYLLRRINASGKSKVVKISLLVLLITLGVIGTIVTFLATYLGLACSRTV